MTAKITRPTIPARPLGLPRTQSGSLAPMGRRPGALLIDWLIAYGLALLGVEIPVFGH